MFVFIVTLSCLAKNTKELILDVTSAAINGVP
jgi:hypothetical protein